MRASAFAEAIRGGLIVSCYAASDYNAAFMSKDAMCALATSVQRGGAAAIRVNLRHISYVKKAVEIPVIGIEKIYVGDEMRITPTIREVEELVSAGADAIGIDGTQRSRFDNLTLRDFVAEIKSRFDIPIVADISTREEGLRAAEWGADAVGTTLSGYTPYSSSVGRLGDIPPAEPDYEIVRELSKRLELPIIAEGRFNSPSKAREALRSGAHAVVVGTAISNPEKVTELFVHALKQEG